MAEKLKFSLVSPERELVARDVDQVVVPGADGDFEVFAKHAPMMSTMLPGIVVVKDGTTEDRIFVRGGFADVTPEGLTVLAEEAIRVEDLKGDLLGEQKNAANNDLQAAQTPEENLAAQRAIEVLGRV
ncbi:MAG: F0F1 ATP synthase subunit epsilon [Aquisalinus sp.]|nr:F0F1 ATP synthase subunit epsilon [Aquisalinus sp.]